MHTDNHKTLVITPATSQHIQQIYLLARSYQLSQIPCNTSRNNLGFLVSKFNEKDYQSFLSSYNHFYVLLEQTNLLGFLLAYSSDRIQTNEQLNLQIKLSYPKPFILIKQICIQSDKLRQGLGTLMYQQLFQQAPEDKFLAAIVLQPLNYRSIAFHKKLGFRQIFKVTPLDQIPRGIWIRDFQEIP